MSGLLPILIIGATQSLFSSILIITKKPSHLENVILSTLLFIIFLEFNLFILDTYDIFSYHFPVLQFTICPLIYLFVNTVTGTKRVFKINHLLHFLPFFIFTALLLYLNPTHNLSISEYLRFNEKFYFRMVISFALFLNIIVYLALSLVTLYKYQKGISTIFSYKSFKNSFNWIKVIVILMSIGYISMFTYSLLLIYGITDTLFNPLGIITIFYVIISYLIGFFGYRQPALFNLPTEDEKEQEDRVLHKNISNELNHELTENVIIRLNDCMINKKAYLKGDLTIEELATDIGISRNVLTQVLNKTLSKNFYKYINEFRIEEAKKLLLDPKFKNFSILAIGYEAGFNSKSTFNAIFKTSVGITPSEYKKKHLNS